MRKTRVIKELLRWLKRQKELRRILIIPALLITVTSCVSTVENNFCLWASPIKLTNDEIDMLTNESVNQILFFNTNYDVNCND
jgi:hypothetical protein